MLAEWVAPMQISPAQSVFPFNPSVDNAFLSAFRSGRLYQCHRKQSYQIYKNWMTDDMRTFKHRETDVSGSEFLAAFQQQWKAIYIIRRN